MGDLHAVSSGNRSRLSPVAHADHAQLQQTAMQELQALPGQALPPGALSVPMPGAPEDPEQQKSSELLSPVNGNTPRTRRKVDALPPIYTQRQNSRPPSTAGSLAATPVPSTGRPLSTLQPPLSAHPAPHTAIASPHRASPQQHTPQPNSPWLPQSPPPPLQPALPVQTAAGEGATKLRVHVITYNMAGNLPTQLPPSFFGDVGPEADIFVIGTQESSSLGDWEKLVAKNLGRSYVKKAQESLMSISLLVYAHTNMAARMSAVRTSSIACGVGNVLGNKGAVGVSCVVDGCRLLLITSHLAAHDEFIDRRNADYQRIYGGLFSSSATSGNSPVPASPGGDSGASTPLRSNSPQHLRGSPHESQSSDVGPNSSGAFSASPSAVSRMSRLAHVSSMSQLPQPSSPPPSARNVDGFGASPTAASQGWSQSSTPRSDHVPVEWTPSLQRFVTQPLTASPRHSALPLHDVVLWSGDLNYRINGTHSAIKHLLDTDMIEVLHANDQLRLQMRKGKVFQGFHEQAIHFPPTFKFKVGSSLYSDKRIPSWTDRILHISYAHEHMCFLEPLYYRSVDSLRDSDHRAVVAGYELTISHLHAPPKSTRGIGGGGRCTIS